MNIGFNTSRCFSESDIYASTATYENSFARKWNRRRHNVIEMHEVNMSKDFIYIFNIFYKERTTFCMRQTLNDTR